MHPELVTSLAMLKANYENYDRDYLETFVPFAAEAIRLSKETVVSLPVVQSDIGLLFGIELPQNVLKVILKRLHRYGLIKIKNKLYYKIQDKLNETKFRNTQMDFKRKYEELNDSLQKFVKENHNQKWSNSDADAALSIYFEENQVLLIDRIINRTKNITTEHPKPGAKYLVASFIKHLQDNDLSQFDYFETVFKGNLLANAIFLTGVYDISQNFKNTTVYFDTPFLLSLLGYAGNARKDPCVELVKLLREVGGGLSVFEHTVYETRGVLKGCAREIGRGNINAMMNSTTEYFIMNHATESDILEYNERLETDLTSMGITIRDKPSYQDEQSVIDESSLEHTIRKRIKYSNDGALIRDIDSISAIVRLRQGRSFHQIEKCQALFVSPNTGLAKSARKFFAFEYPSWTIPVCITDYELTNLLWVKKPLSAPNLPRKKIIADVYAAMQPETANPQIFTSFIRELDKQHKQRQISTEEYVNTRYRMESKRAFMDITLGEKEALTEGTIIEIIELSDKRIREEERQAAVEESAKSILHVREVYRIEQEKLSANFAAEELQRKSLEQSFSLAQEEQKKRETSIKTRATKWAHHTVFLIEILTAFLTIIGTALTFPWLDLGFSKLSSYVRAVLSCVWFVLVIFGFANLFYGTSVKPLLEQLEKNISDRIEKTLKSLTA